jgi:hypothetical protein
MIILHFQAQIGCGAEAVGEDTPALTFPCWPSFVLLALKIRTRVLQLDGSLDIVSVSL